MTFSCINRRETDLTTFHLKSQRKAKRKKKRTKKREGTRSSLACSATAAVVADVTRFFSSLFRLFYLSFHPDFLPSLRFRLQFRPRRVLLENCFFFSLSGFFLRWISFIETHFFFVSLRLFVWPLNCHLAASIDGGQLCRGIDMFSLNRYFITVM